jgi:hypothetical protein
MAEAINEGKALRAQDAVDESGEAKEGEEVASGDISDDEKEALIKEAAAESKEEATPKAEEAPKADEDKKEEK